MVEEEPRRGWFDLDEDDRLLRSGIFCGFKKRGREFCRPFGRKDGKNRVRCRRAQIAGGTFCAVHKEGGEEEKEELCFFQSWLGCTAASRAGSKFVSFIDDFMHYIGDGQ